MFEPIGGQRAEYTNQNVINPLAAVCAGCDDDGLPRRDRDGQRHKKAPSSRSCARKLKTLGRRPDGLRHKGSRRPGGGHRLAGACRSSSARSLQMAPAHLEETIRIFHGERDALVRFRGGHRRGRAFSNYSCLIARRKVGSNQAFVALAASRGVPSIARRSPVLGVIFVVRHYGALAQNLGPCHG